MIDLPTLHPHQEEMRDSIRKALVQYRNVIASAPPGTGKTRLAKWVLGAFSNRDKREGESGRALFAVHRRTLVDNASGSFQEAPELPHGMIMAGNETYGGIPVQVASIDTILSWYCEGGEYRSDYTFDVVIFDECHAHHSKLQTFLKCHEAKRKELGQRQPYVLGLSATPQARGLSDIYKTIVQGPSTQWLIDNAYLSNFRYFKATEGQLGKLIRKGDEYTPDSVSAAMDGLSGDLVRDWKRLADGRATVGFFPRLAHADQAKYELVRAGVKAEYVDGSTPDEERRQIFSDLNSGHIDYVCNVGVVERGTDIPRIGCVQLCTAIGSVVRYLQMIGRGSRIHPDKDDCLILDHGGNIKRHGFFEDQVEWSLDWTERPSKDHEARASIECPSCKAIYRGGKCQCGYEPTAKERKSQGLEFDGRELTEVKARDKKAKKKKTCEELWVSALFMAGKSRRTFRQAYGIACNAARNQGTNFQMPKTFSVAGGTYRNPPYGSPQQARRVSELYPFTVGNYDRRDNNYRIG